MSMPPPMRSLQFQRSIHQKLCQINNLVYSTSRNPPCIPFFLDKHLYLSSTIRLMNYILHNIHERICEKLEEASQIEDQLRALQQVTY